MRSQKGQNYRGQNDPTKNFAQRHSSSFSERKIFRPETLPEIRASAVTLPASLTVDVSDDDMETSDDDENMPTQLEETTLRNFIQELSDRATSPSADVTNFDPEPGAATAISQTGGGRDDEELEEEEYDGEEEEDEPSNFERVVGAKMETFANEDMEDLMQPLDSERKHSIPNKKGSSIYLFVYLFIYISF